MLIGGVVLLLACLGAYAFSRAADSFRSGFSFTDDRVRLKPVPVRAEACPSVERIHRAANRFDVAYPPLGPFVISTDGRLVQKPWPQVRSEVGRAAEGLKKAIDAGFATFPPRIQRYLAITRRDIEAGQQKLLVATSWTDLDNRASTIVDHGRTAFGSASDLVGRQCGTRLAARSR